MIVAEKREYFQIMFFKDTSFLENFHYVSLLVQLIRYMQPCGLYPNKPDLCIHNMIIA